MLTQYIDAAMQLATYEIFEDGTFYGEIPITKGVWANSDSLESCRTELREVLEDWIVVGLRRGHELPEINGIGFKIELESA